MTVPFPVRLPDAMCVSTVDTRGIDLYPSLFPVSDSVGAITTILVTRLDELPIAEGDLMITPVGKASPWISANLAGVPNMAINWWQGVGTMAQISDQVEVGDVITPPCVAYNIAVSFLTTAGRQLTYTALQLVSPIVG